MGDMADDAMFDSLQYELEQEFKLEETIRKAKEIKEYYSYGILKWETKIFEEILLQDMTDQHIKNCHSRLIRMEDVYGENEIRSAWIFVLNCEIIKRKL